VAARFIAGFSLALLLASAGEAQQFDRRSRDEPEVVIEAGGRVGTADVVRFTPDGGFLLAGGDDKVVRVFPHSAAGLDGTPDRAKILRWRGWRDQLGGIKCLSPSPDGKRVAVGGYGLRISSVAILDRETGETTAITWPRTREGSYHDAVTAIGFHPDGKRVSFGTADGTLWFWDPMKLDKSEGDRVWNAPVCAGQFANPNPQQLNFTRSIRFPDADTMVAVSARGQVLACDLKAKLTDDPAAPIPAGKTLFEVFAGQKEDYRVHHAEWTGDVKWLAAITTGPLVLLRSADGKETKRIELPRDHFARSFAVHPTSGKIAIGVGSALPAVAKKPRFYMEPDDAIWVFTDATAEPKKLRHPGRAEAMTFHPKLDRLAIAGGDADELTLLDLASPEKPVSVVRGTGRRMYSVNLSESGDTIAVKTGRNPAATDPNDRAKGDWVRFNVPRFVPSLNDRGTWLGPVNSSGGWEIVPDASSRFVWYAERAKADGTRERLQLLLDQDLDQSPTCFSLVPTAEGKPQRVIVGHYYGCSLFVLNPAAAKRNAKSGVLELPRSKLFIGHGAEVNAIAPDKTGTWFITAGSDQTVAAWSLDDWISQPALGGSFKVDAGNVVVDAVDVGSPAWEAGLSKGDRIELLAVGGKAVFDRRKKSNVGTVEAATELLKQPQSGIELFFGWATARGERRATPTRIKQRPMWKWFPSFDDRGRLSDSVMWMWHGSYYYTSSMHGDRLVGWHVNAPEVTGTPEFHPLERYKHLFLRPDVLAKLIETRSVAAALKEAAGENPLRRSFREVEAEPVELALQNTTVRADGVKLTVAVTPRGNNPDLLPERVELWVNDYRVRVWPGKGKEAFREEVQIPAAAFRSGNNQIAVLAMNPLRGRAEAVGVVHNPAKAPEPNLTGFAIGINNYAAHRTVVTGARAFGDLGKAKADAVELTQRLLTYRGEGKCFPQGNVSTILDDAAERKGILTALGDLKKSAVRPDDVLVVFFAGHGDLLTPGGKPLPPPMGMDLAARGLAADSGKFVFCCPDYAPTKPDATAISCEELFEALAEINCRKLVLLDACHAGGAAEANLLRRFIPNGQGPLVIASCDQHELSFEDNKLGHGVFTFAVLEALGQKFRLADTSTDGILTAAELYEYLADRVPSLVKELRPGNTQNPICFPHPSSLSKTTLLKK
jgi:WD40 repeat protein/uncharacterized caspase-like protein